MKKLLLLLLVLPLLFPGVSVFADSSTDVTVTASGFICGAPGSFTLTYVDDFTVGISWVKPLGAVNTMVRTAYGRIPTSRTDGYLVYYGAGASFTDNATSLAAPDVSYYRAWSQRADGAWEEVGSSNNTGGFMSASFLFLVWVVLGLALLWFEIRRPDILLMLAGFITWLSLGFWLLLGGITNLELTQPWTKIFVWVPFILAFVVPLYHMNAEIKHEYKGTSWSTVGDEPKEERPDSYKAYQKRIGKLWRTQSGRR